jgi:hypothetical protein
MDEAPSIGSHIRLLPVDQWAEPKRQPAQSLAAHPRLAPPTTEEVVVQLSRCLTLCAPSGWTTEDRAEWLAVAMEEIGGVPGEAFVEACRHARRVCDHPAKLIPAIAAQAPIETRRLHDAIARENRVPRLMVVPATPAEPRPRLTQAEVDTMAPALLHLGVSIGAIIRDGDEYRVAPDETDAA